MSESKDLNQELEELLDAELTEEEVSAIEEEIADLDEVNWDKISNIRLLFLSTQKELCAQISRAIGLGIKVFHFGFCCVGDNG